VGNSKQGIPKVSKMEIKVKCPRGKNIRNMSHAKKLINRRRGFDEALLATCFMLVLSLAYSLTLKIKATCSLEVYIEFQFMGIISPKTIILHVLLPHTCRLVVPKAVPLLLHRIRFFHVIL
jgi:hypothetical protein